MIGCLLRTLRGFFECLVCTATLYRGVVIFLYGCIVYINILCDDDVRV